MRFVDIWAEWARAAIVAISLLTTVALSLEYWVLPTSDWVLVVDEFCLVGVLFGLVVLYVAYRGQALAVFASILSAIITILLLETYASIYRIFGIVDSSSHQVIHDSQDCFYFSLVTFTTLGYGDFYPTLQARIVAASEALVGYVSLAALIGVFAHMWSQLMDEKSD